MAPSVQYAKALKFIDPYLGVEYWAWQHGVAMREWPVIRVIVVVSALVL